MDHLLIRPRISRNPTSHSVTPSTTSDDHYMRCLADEAYSRHPITPRSAAGSSFRTLGLGGSGVGGISEEQYRVLAELQRVIYYSTCQGSLLDDEEVGEDDGAVDADRKEQVRKFVQQHFEIDCRRCPSVPSLVSDMLKRSLLRHTIVYESPLITLQSRPLFLNALALSADLASSRLPSIYPRALITHTQSVARWSFRKFFGCQTTPTSSSTTAIAGKPAPASGGRLEEIARVLVPWLVDDAQFNNGKGKGDAWWDIWHLSSECGEIGGFETYEGYHLGIIDHTMTLKLLPSLLPPTFTEEDLVVEEFASHRATSASAFTSPAPSTAHLHSLSPSIRLRLRTRTRPAPVPVEGSSLPLAVIQKCLASLLTYRLRLRTFVEFNEQGRVCYIRDMVDVRDAWESLVPFGRAAGWIGRRVCGVVVAGLGRVFGCSPADEEGNMWEREREREREKKEMEGLYAHRLALQDAAGAVTAEGRYSVREAHGVPHSSLKNQQPHALSNMLGLQEAWSPFHPTSAQLTTTTMTDFTAPDVDEGGEMTDH
ncbi:hypothetical protein QFC19_004940 [Naganishia cerealis]|uniref:Uncharacterized protein n=1 Tax=Naganishia cerealis TaxID=610337 RepID=A0ACC2VT03_9TREE|nr:hypothetical protein QFC19_004940 [Naganishia cerealis]